MTSSEWATLAEFGVLLVLIDLISPRIATVMAGALIISAVIQHGGDIWSIFPQSKKTTTQVGR